MSIAPVVDKHIRLNEYSIYPLHWTKCLSYSRNWPLTPRNRLKLMILPNSWIWTPKMFKFRKPNRECSGRVCLLLLYFSHTTKAFSCIYISTNKIRFVYYIIYVITKHVESLLQRDNIYSVHDHYVLIHNAYISWMSVELNEILLDLRFLRRWLWTRHSLQPNPVPIVKYVTLVLHNDMQCSITCGKLWNTCLLT